MLEGTYTKMTEVGLPLLLIVELQCVTFASIRCCGQHDIVMAATLSLSFGCHSFPSVSAVDDRQNKKLAAVQTLLVHNHQGLQCPLW